MIAHAHGVLRNGVRTHHRSSLYSQSALQFHSTQVNTPIRKVWPVFMKPTNAQHSVKRADLLYRAEPKLDRKYGEYGWKFVYAFMQRFS